MIQLSKNSGLTSLVSSGNPITTEHPHTGSAQTVQLWAFNDNSAKRYESITITAVDTTGTNESSWIQFSNDNVTFSSSLTLANISDSNVGKSFYVRVTTPSVAETQNKSDIKLNVAYTEFAV